MNIPTNPLLAFLGHSLLSSLALVVLGLAAIVLDIFAAHAVSLGASPETAHLIELSALWVLRLDLVLWGALLLGNAARFLKHHVF